MRPMTDLEKYLQDMLTIALNEPDDGKRVVTMQHFKMVASLPDTKALYFLKMYRDGQWDIKRLKAEIKRTKELEKERKAKEKVMRAKR